MKIGSFRRSTIHLALGAAVVGVPLDSALAQEPQQEVVITGSRIARASDFESPSPVITLSHEAIEKSGYSNLQQLMERIPVNGNGAFSTRGNNQDSTANGAASISLRGLGADATLVLVNGRRVAVELVRGERDYQFRRHQLDPGRRHRACGSAQGRLFRCVRLRTPSRVWSTSSCARTSMASKRPPATAACTSGPYDERTASAIWGHGTESSNVTRDPRLLPQHHAVQQVDRGSLGSSDQTAQGGEDFRSSRGYPGRFTVNGVIRRDPACPADRIAGETCPVRLRAVEPAHPEGRTHGPHGARPSGRRQHGGIRRDRCSAQHVVRAGRTDAARRNRAHDGAGEPSQQSVPGCHNDRHQPLPHRRRGPASVGYPDG